MDIFICTWLGTSCPEMVKDEYDRKEIKCASIDTNGRMFNSTVRDERRRKRQAERERERDCARM